MLVAFAGYVDDLWWHGVGLWTRFRGLSRVTDVPMKPLTRQNVQHPLWRNPTLSYQPDDETRLTLLIRADFVYSLSITMPFTWLNELGGRYCKSLGINGFYIFRLWTELKGVSLIPKTSDPRTSNDVSSVEFDDRLDPPQGGATGSWMQQFAGLWCLILSIEAHIIKWNHHWVNLTGRWVASNRLNVQLLLLKTALKAPTWPISYFLVRYAAMIGVSRTLANCFSWRHCSKTGPGWTSASWAIATSFLNKRRRFAAAPVRLT